MTRAHDRRPSNAALGLWALGAALLTLAPLSACDSPVSRPDAGRRDANVASLDAPGLDAPGLDAASSGEDDAAVHAMVTPEICTNGIDEDRNGSIDDGCPCAVGTRRACWPGAPEHRSVGACVDGEQTCDSDGVMAAFSACMGATMPTREVRANDTDDDCDGTTDEPDAVCEPSEQRESTCDDGLDSDCDTATDCDDPDCRTSRDCEMRCAAEEVVCWGEVDDDCDMQIDCDDPDCAADPSCRPGSDCPDGQVRTYRQRRLGASAGGSSIAPGDGQPPMSSDCEDGTCPAGQVRVITATMNVCVPPPPECPEGRYANYTGYASWECEPPCEIIIHYGGIYGGLNVCTERPRLSCPSGQSPTFVYETQEWVCRPTCDNTLYDRIVLDGAVVCVPC